MDLIQDSKAKEKKEKRRRKTIIDISTYLKDEVTIKPHSAKLDKSYNTKTGVDERILRGEKSNPIDINEVKRMSNPNNRIYGGVLSILRRSGERKPSSQRGQA
jgi:hypothetical protein